jgi:MFS family permease
VDSTDQDKNPLQDEDRIPEENGVQEEHRIQDENRSPMIAPELVPRESPRSLGAWIFALAILSFGGQIYTEITGDWFPTFIHYTAGYPYVYWGYVSATSSIIGAVFFIIFGAVSDNMRSRYGRRIPFMVIGGVVISVLCALFVQSTNYFLLFLNYGILTAIAGGFARAGSAALTPDLIPLEKRGRVNTLITVMSNLGSAVAWIPALMFLPGNGTSYPPETVRIFVYAGAAIYGITLIFGCALIREPPIVEPPHRWVDDMKSTLNWREMAKQKDFLLIFITNLLYNAASSAIFNYLFVFIQNINFVFSITVIIGAVIVVVALVTGLYLLGKSIDTIGRKFVTILGLSLAPIGSWVIALTNGNLLGLLIGFGIFFPFFLGGSTAMTAWTQDIMPKDARARFFGLLNIASAIGAGLGTILSGALADEFSIFWIFVAAALILWASIPFYLRIRETLVKKKPASDTVIEPEITPA